MTNDIERFFNATIGYQPILRMMNDMEKHTKFPPTNITSYKDGDTTHFKVELALAGWSFDEISVKFGDRKLIVMGEPITLNDDGVTIIQQGISKRAFTWQKAVPDDIVVEEVQLIDGLLTIELTEVIPESKRIRDIPIKMIS